MTSRGPTWLRRAGTATGRLGMLAAIVAASGLAVGLAVAYPISKIELPTEDAVVLEQNSVKSFDLADALIQPDDLPSGWSLSETDLAAYSMIGQPICGQTPTIDNQMGNKLTRTYADGPSTSPEQLAQRNLILTEAVRVNRVADAVNFVNEMGDTFDGCKRGFYRKNLDGSSTKVELRVGQPDPPITDYQTRTLIPPKNEKLQRLVFMAVGDVIISIQYVGDTTPRPDLLGVAQRKILRRLVPDQFGNRRKVPGEETLPSEPTTTSTTTTTLPPTTLAPTTTTRPKRRSSTTRPPTTKPPTTAPPATAAPGQ